MRKMRRLSAKFHMKRSGMVRICEHRGTRGHGSKKGFLNQIDDSGNRSAFAEHWREYV
jgi:hypothetical protein